MPDFSCGRSLYIDWRMVVVVEENVLHHVKKEGGGMSRGICPRGECHTLNSLGEVGGRHPGEPRVAVVEL